MAYFCALIVAPLVLVACHFAADGFLVFLWAMKRDGEQRIV